MGAVKTTNLTQTLQSKIWNLIFIQIRHYKVRSDISSHTQLLVTHHYRMKSLFLSLLLASAQCGPQLLFSKSGKKNDSVNTRLGLLATDLGLDPTASQGTVQTNQGSSSSSSSSSNAAFTAEEPAASGRVPTSGGSQQCCCVPSSEFCEDPFGGGQDLVGSGLIDPRLKNNTNLQTRGGFSGISTRIVNRPNVNTNAQQNTCPVGQKACCYDASIDLSVFGITCINPQSANQFVPWTQGCADNAPRSNKMCGTRQAVLPSNPGGDFADSLPGEFPWTCLLLNQNNDFIGSCAIIPDNSKNDNRRPTRKVITAAHKLKSLQQNDLLKVRVGEWDASGFNQPEQQNHQEYTIVRILKHPQFSAGRLSNDIALLYTDRDIDLSQSNVNTACLPSCDNQFDYVFNNGTGVRCWVAGWGKNEFDGSFLSFRRRLRFLLFLIRDATTTSKLLSTIRDKAPGTGSSFTLVRCVQGERLGRMRAQEMVDHLWCARLSLEDGLLLVWLLVS